MLRNPTVFKQRQRQRAVVPGWLLVLEAQTRKHMAEQVRQARAKHPRKKQPRHVRIAQPLKPLNPHSR